MEQVKWSEPVTYGSSKFEVMTVELHARPVAVVDTLSDARLISVAPDMDKALAWIDSLVSRDEGCDGDDLQAISDRIRAVRAKATGA